MAATAVASPAAAEVRSPPPVARDRAPTGEAHGGGDEPRGAAVAGAGQVTTSADLARAYLEVRLELEAGRRRLAAELERAPRPAEVLRGAADTLRQGVAAELLPRWVGMSWGRGASSLARRPFEPDQTVNCGSFAVAVLEGAGFRFRNRLRMAQAPALRLLEGLASEGAIQRWQRSPSELARALVRRGDGVYLLGLARHVAFAVVDEGEVRLVHASRALGQVVAEPLADAAALRRSRQIFVAALVLASPSTPRATRARDELVARWLAGVAIGPR